MQVNGCRLAEAWKTTNNDCVIHTTPETVKR